MWRLYAPPPQRGKTVPLMEYYPATLVELDPMLATWSVQYAAGHGEVGVALSRIACYGPEEHTVLCEGHWPRGIVIVVALCRMCMLCL